LPRVSDPIVLTVLVAGTCAAAAIDLRTRRVPNRLTTAIAAAGLGLAAFGAGEIGLKASLAGLALGMVLMLPGHLFGGTGAGDVKLMAAVGSLVGPARIVTTFLDMAIAGGILAIAVAWQRRRLRATLGGAARALATGAANASEIEAPGVNNRFAYAPAIAIGALAAALGW
jgi:prepilin peptidase CpaA